MVVELEKMSASDVKEMISKADSKMLAELIKEVVSTFDTDVDKWVIKHNKSAARRLRTKTVLLDKLGKAFRQKSVAELKENDFVE